MGKRRLAGWLMIAAAVVLLLWAAYEFLWPTYSWEKYIVAADLRLAVISDPRGTYEVYQSESPRLLRRLAGAINGGRRRYPQTKLGVGEGEIIMYPSGSPCTLILYGWRGKDSAVLFRDASTGYSQGGTLYRSRGLARILRRLSGSSECKPKRPSVPPESLARAVLFHAGTERVLAGSHTNAGHLVNSINNFLASVRTTFYSLSGGPAVPLFYEGKLDPRVHLSQTTGALLLLRPALSMHTNVMFWERDSGPRAEYHEFKTNMILISDALSIKGSSSREPRRVVGFSSDAKPNRFYLFDADIPANDEEAGETAAKWNKLIRTIREAVATGSGVSPQAREVNVNR